jgi:hypothetical protein
MRGVANLVHRRNDAVLIDVGAGLILTSNVRSENGCGHQFAPKRQDKWISYTTPPRDFPIRPLLPFRIFQEAHDGIAFIGVAALITVRRIING